MEEFIVDAQKAIQHQFRQVKLLRIALTHSSFANESEEELENNERLEFLGDAVLELCISEELCDRFPDVREGDLTRMRAKLVSRPGLFEVARSIELDKYVLLGKGEEGQGGRERKSLLSDAVEAVLGAIFLDGGYPAAKAWVGAVFADFWPKGPDPAKIKDYKSRLQEMTQQFHKERPVYTLVRSTGPEHDKTFEVSLTLPSGETVTALGQSLKKAEQKAAREAIKLIEAAGMRERE